jgi:acyl-CoA synthetase (AMP-forming)/AMP-acid ligase II
MAFGEARWTYADLDQRIDACAKGLIALEVKRGDRIAMLTSPRPEYLIVFLAATRIGAIWLGINPAYTLDEMRYIISDAQPKLFFAFNSLRGRDYSSEITALRVEFSPLQMVIWGDTPHDALSYEDLLEAGRHITDEVLDGLASAVSPQDVALIVYTSGSTGRSKGAMLTQGGIFLAARAQLRQWPLSPLRALCYFPANHIGCSTETVAYALAGGGTVIFNEYFDAELALRTIEAEKVSWIVGVPAMFHKLLTAFEGGHYDTSSLRVVFFSGAGTPKELIRRLQGLGGELYTTWGMTETTCSVTFTAAGDDLDVLTETVGRVVPPHEIGIVNDAGGDAPTGEAGEVLVRGPCVFAGYYNRSEPVFDDCGWFHTGDIGLIDSAGRLRLIGRKLDVFKSGGYNIYPREVEIALEGHPSVSMAVVVGVPDAIYQEVSCAFLLCEGEVPDEREISDFCRGKLANYKIPKKFYFRRALPMVSVGKIDRQNLWQEAMRLARA